MQAPDVREEVRLHGHRICFRRAGDGPLLLLVHGITGSARHWERLVPALAERHAVLVPDLLGHGESAKPRGDYSLGAFASGLRDLLLALGCDRATVVGHSLGGGIAMQFAYQFPERCDRLVLIDSGGLGPEVHQLLRLAALPGSELVLPLLTDDRLRGVTAGAARRLRKLGLEAGPDLAEMVRGLDTLADGATRHAFLATLRAVVGPQGQRIDARDRLYLASVMPTLIIWGEDDPIIPAAHGIEAHRMMPGSRLELLPAGHFPHLERPDEVARAIADFVASTAPARAAVDELRARVAASASGSA